MPASAENLRTFLAKRGYDTDVDRNPDNNTFTIGIRCQTAEEVARLLAQIDEPGRFVVSVQLTDIADILLEPAMSAIQHIQDELNGLTKAQEEATMDRQNLRNTQDDAENHSRKTLEGISQRIDRLERIILGLRDILDTVNKRPWWKKWW